MMFATRVFQLVILAVAVLCIAQGSWWDEHRIPSRAMIRRQAGDEVSTPGAADPTSSGGSVPSSTNQPEESSSSEAVEESSSELPQPSETSTSVTTTEEQSSSTGAPASTSASVPQTSTTESEEEQSTTGAPTSTTTSADTTADTTADDSVSSQTVSTSFTFSTETKSDGTVETHTSKVLTTLTPGLNDKSDSDNSGMSTKTRNTIIGVVVGVGGAIVLGALGLVAWRIWGRKKQAEENDGLMAYDPGYSGAAEKSEPSHSPSASTSQRTANNPFQSTLENYHQPTPVNASSNF
jgi:hypothetical protein